MLQTRLAQSFEAEIPSINGSIEVNDPLRLGGRVFNYPLMLDLSDQNGAIDTPLDYILKFVI